MARNFLRNICLSQSLLEETEKVSYQARNVLLLFGKGYRKAGSLINPYTCKVQPFN